MQLNGCRNSFISRFVLYMKIISVNRGEARTVNWQKAEVQTGIFKYPVERAVFLGREDEVEDAVVDRKYHGGIDKAVYAYSLNHYPFWKERFPDLDWNYGMFGENLTIEGMEESKMLIGSIYKVGEVQIQICQPRQPCFKLGSRFNTQAVLKPFINEPFSGVYIRVIQTGKVKSGDELKLIIDESESPSIAEVYRWMYQKTQGAESLIDSSIACKFLPDGCKDRIKQTQIA